MDIHKIDTTTQTNYPRENRQGPHPMTQSRSTQISLDATSFYHCYVRCVRRAYLCGDDRATGANYDHRKQWLVSRLRFLSYIYAIDIPNYHYP